MDYILKETRRLHPKINKSSQTIYEVLLGCLKMYESTKLETWKNRSDYILSLLKEIQQADGGFDIGYEFNFGMMHKKGESTSPELIGLLAYCQYARVFNKHDDIYNSVKKSVDWIRTHAVKINDKEWAIPYSPYTTTEIMVYNGTSFACGALGYYLGIYCDTDSELEEIYRGMVCYLESNLNLDKNLNGRFWYYNDQKRNDMTVLMKNKIDYYHQMQQVELHSIAQQVSPIDKQITIIEECSDHIIAISDKYEILPYSNSYVYFKDLVHVWGLASVASGLIEASKIVKTKKTEYISYADYVIKWLVRNSWNGEYFEPIITKEGKKASYNGYMVRSDAWVFNSLATYYKEVDMNLTYLEILEKCYIKMERNDFSGRESHASSLPKKIVSKVFVWLKKIKK
jgi:hypothetical protein